MIRALFRSALVILALAPPLQAETNIQEVVSPGGLKAWLVEDHGIPFTALQIRFSGGTSLDRAGKRGAVNLMTALIEEGAGDLDSQGFAAARDDLAARIGFASDQDGLSVSATFLMVSSVMLPDASRSILRAVWARAMATASRICSSVKLSVRMRSGFVARA